MANAAEAGRGVAEGATQSTQTLASYLAAHWWNLLVVVVVIAFLVYTVIYMRNKFPIVREFMVFLKERKLWWMSPIIVIFILLAALIVTMESSAIAPFIYALF
jgi:heme/copper-type cytochrome/quinol oxidase subunit 2